MHNTLPRDLTGNQFLDLGSGSDANLTRHLRGIYVGTAGDVKIKALDGNDYTFKNLAAGVIHPIAAIRVWATGTTASQIIGIY